jgi:transcriptional antiterminator NusG
MEEDNRVDKNPVIEDEKWFVVHTYSGYENKVAENIKKVAVNREMDKQRKILDAVVPTETVQTNDGKGGKKKNNNEKNLPGLCFCQDGRILHRRGK